MLDSPGMPKRTRPLRVLCYADMDAAVQYCVSAAEMLRAQLGAHIIMMVVNTRFQFHEAFANYEVYDHKVLDRPSNRFAPVELTRGNNNSDLARVDDISADVPRLELFGMRNILARSEILKKLYRVLRNPVRYGKSWVRRIPGYELFMYPIRTWYRTMRLRTFLRTVRPDLIILAEDNVERLSTPLINEGRRKCIPSIIVPFTIPNPLEPARAYRHLAAHQVRGPLTRSIRRLFPKWCYRLGDQDLLRVPALTALMIEALGQSSPAPWILNRGNASRIALDSEALRDLYLRLGFPKGQLSVIGDINGATLHGALVNKSKLLPELLAEHGLLPGRPLILCGFPPDQFASKGDDFEFQDYDALIEAWIGSFRVLADRANVLIRPHPRIPLTRFDAFNAPNVRYTMRPTAELIPLCDLYVASISATIRWAIACGIPVINYDTYRYRYGDYDGAAGVISTESLLDFRNQLTRFVDDRAFAAELSQRQKGVMHHWGIVDDGLAERFAALATTLVEESRAKRHYRQCAT